MAEQKRYLDEGGLVHFWNTKIKPLIYKKATLQEDLEVKNPRVTVDLPDGYTFPAGSTMEDLFRYLYRHVYDEFQPNLTVQLPSVTVKVTIPTSAEVDDDVTYTVSKKAFNQGKIGTCVAPWEEEAHQERINSGSSEVANTFKIYSGNTNVPAECTDEPEMVDGVVTGTLHVSNKGTNNIGIYFCGTTSYTQSTAQSKTSYGNNASVSGVSSFGAGVTSKSPCVTNYIVGYFPSFGNVSFAETENSPTTEEIGDRANLGSRFNSVGEGEFYYGPTNTDQGNDVTFEIYFPSTFNGSVQYWDTITNAWTDVPTTTTSGHFATMPAKNDTTHYPYNDLVTGTEYKLIRQSQGYVYGKRKYKLILTNA